MSKGKLNIDAVGRLGADPEVSVTSSGLKVTNFRIAVNRKYKGEEEVTWIGVACFDKLAEIASQYLSKGNNVNVVGSLRLKKYTRKDGTEKLDVSIQANDIIFLESKKDAEYRQPAPTGAGTNEVVDDDLPF